MPVFENQAELAGLWVIVVLVWIDYVASPILFKYFVDWDWYDCIAKRVPGMPRKGIFAIVWMILYVLITVSMFWFFRNGFDAFTDVDSNIRDTIGFVFLFNMLLKNMWTPAFFAMKETRYALVILILTLASAAVILVLFAIEGLWASFSTWIPYVIWLIYALYLNIAFVVAESKYEKECNPCVQEKKPICSDSASVVNGKMNDVQLRNHFQKKLQNMV